MCVLLGFLEYPRTLRTSWSMAMDVWLWLSGIGYGDGVSSSARTLITCGCARPCMLQLASPTAVLIRVLRINSYTSRYSGIEIRIPTHWRCHLLGMKPAAMFRSAVCCTCHIQMYGGRVHVHYAKKICGRKIIFKRTVRGVLKIFGPITFAYVRPGPHTS